MPTPKITQRYLESVQELGPMVEPLVHHFVSQRGYISRQNDFIESLRTQIEEGERRERDLARENARLRAELKAAR